MLARELPEEERHDDRGRARRRANLERPRQLTVLRAGEAGEQLLLGCEHPLRRAVEPLACVGRDDPPARPVEQLLPDAPLERPHLLADRRLGDAEGGRRLGEAPPLDDRAECSKLLRLHNPGLYHGHTPATNQHQLAPQCLALEV